MEVSGDVNTGSNRVKWDDIKEEDEKEDKNGKETSFAVAIMDEVDNREREDSANNKRPVKKNPPRLQRQSTM